MRLLGLVLAIVGCALFLGAPGQGVGQAQAQSPPRRPAALESFLPLPPPPTPVPPPMRQPAPAGTTGAPPAAPTSMIWATIYAAVPPARAHGVSAPTRDRLMAHQRAETLCRAGPGGNTCRRVLEISQGCAVLVQAARDDRLHAAAQADPNQPVMVAMGGTGPTAEEAARDGMDQCQRRVRGAMCRVVATVCAR